MRRNNWELKRSSWEMRRNNWEKVNYMQWCA